MERVKVVKFINHKNSPAEGYGVGTDSEDQINEAMEAIQNEGHKILDIHHGQFSCLIRYKQSVFMRINK